MSSAARTPSSEATATWCGRMVLEHAAQGTLQPIYEGGRVDADRFVPARWDLLPEGRYMWGSVQTVRGCPKHCSFCSVWRTDGQKPRQRAVDSVVDEIVELRRRGFRFVALADDNFYPVTLADLAMAERQGNAARLEQLRALRAERFELMARLAELPSRHGVLHPDHDGSGRGRGVPRRDAEGQHQGRAGRRRGGDARRAEGRLQGLQRGRRGAGRSGCASSASTASTSSARSSSACRAIGPRPSTRRRTSPSAPEVAFAQFVMLTPYPGTVDFEAWEKKRGRATPSSVAGIPITRHWLIPQAQRPKVYAPHPVMTPDEIRARTQAVWDRFYSLRRIWERSRCTPTLRSRLAFVLISKLYRQMYANTGIATDSARVSRANRWARLIARPCRRLFVARPLPELSLPSA